MERVVCICGLSMRKMNICSHILTTTHKRRLIGALKEQDKEIVFIEKKKIVNREKYREKLRFWTTDEWIEYKKFKERFAENRKKQLIEKTQFKVQNGIYSVPFD